MEFADIMDLAAQFFEVVGVGILLVGGIWSAGRTLSERGQGVDTYTALRRRFGRTLLLGLEVLVAADIVKTVAVESTLESVLVLAVLVIVRTVLSLSLDAEIDGVAPWRRAALEAEAQRREPVTSRPDPTSDPRLP